MKARLADLGGIPIAGSPADFGKLIADETEKWAKVIRSGEHQAGVRPVISLTSPDVPNRRTPAIVRRANSTHERVIRRASVVVVK